MKARQEKIIRFHTSDLPDETKLRIFDDIKETGGMAYCHPDNSGDIIDEDALEVWLNDNLKSYVYKIPAWPYTSFTLYFKTSEDLATFLLRFGS